jgi:CheY-like chemotaxis protein
VTIIPTVAGEATCQRVLLIDDDKDTLDTLCDVLRMEGVREVRCATSVPEAEQVLGSGFMPSVVVLDLLLDGARGEAFASALRAKPKYACLPIIALSGDPRRLQAVGSNFQGAYLKPVDLDTLVAALNELSSAWGNKLAG